MKVGDLLNTPSLGIMVRAGARGLGRAVVWAHISELDNPAMWLEGGELLLTTGIGVPVVPDEQVAYLERLAERGVAALAIGRGGHNPRLSDEMLAHADTLDFPVLEIPHELPFGAITRLVAAANEHTLQRRMLSSLRIFETLRSWSVERMSAPDLFDRLGQVSGYNLYLSSPRGQPLLDGVDAPAEHIIDWDTEPVLTAIPGGYVVPVSYGTRTAGYLVAVQREATNVGGLIGVQHMATVIAIEVSRLYHERELALERGAQLLSDLVDGTRGHARTDALQAANLVDDVVVAVVEIPVQYAIEEALVELHHSLCDARFPHLLLRQDQTILMLVRDDAEVLAAVVAGCRVGVSRRFSGGAGVPLATGEARWALARHVEDGGVEYFAGTETDASWLPADPSSLRAFAVHVLGPVLVYDSDHSSWLVESLRAYFVHDGRLEQAARSLHVHKNTLSYRLRTVERLTDRRLSNMCDLVELWLAVRAYALVQADARKETTFEAPDSL